jgi:hypothetical protein
VAELYSIRTLRENFWKGEKQKNGFITLRENFGMEKQNKRMALHCQEIAQIR